jgi:hypothetical protein
MKKLLTTVLVLSSLTTFATEQTRFKVTPGSIQALEVTSTCVPDGDYGSIGKKDMMFELRLKIEGEFYSKSYRSPHYFNECAGLEGEAKNAELEGILKDLEDIEDGNIQILKTEKGFACYKDVMTLLLDKNEKGNAIREVISSYKIVTCP